jgi:hypothetical protein
MSEIHRVDGGALAGLEAVVVGAELDVEDAEAVELVEDVCGGIGGGAERIFSSAMAKFWCKVKAGGGTLEGLFCL